MNFFYPLPNQGDARRRLRGLPAVRARDAQAAARRHPARPPSQQERHAVLPRQLPASRPEQHHVRGAATRFTNLPILDTRLDTASAIGGWTKILSPTVVNEFRTGYNYDNSSGRAPSRPPRSRPSSGSKTPEPAPIARVPVLHVLGREPAHGHRATQARNVDRTLDQNAFSISDNLTWIAGGHSLKAGGLWTRNMARDGFGIGLELPGPVCVQRRADRQRVHRFPPGPAAAGAGQHQQPGTARWPLERLRVFVQDDWKVNRSLTVFLGLRYEIVGNWHEKDDLLANFIIDDGGHHVVPNAEVAAKLPPGVIALDRTLLASDVGLPEYSHPHRSETTSARASASPGGSTRATRRCCAAGSACSIRPSPSRAFATCWRPTSSDTATRAGACHAATRLLGRAASSVDPHDYGSEGIDPDIQSPDIYQYNLTSSGSCRATSACA